MARYCTVLVTRRVAGIRTMIVYSFSVIGVEVNAVNVPFRTEVARSDMENEERGVCREREQVE